MFAVNNKLVYSSHCRNDFNIYVDVGDDAKFMGMAVKRALIDKNIELKTLRYKYSWQIWGEHYYIASRKCFYLKDECIGDLLDQIKESN